MGNDLEIDVKNLSFHYSSKKDALRGINLAIPKNAITALIGPSGCGKTTLLRCFNRLHDLYPHNTYEGEIYFRNQNILSKGIDLIELRSQIGMVFQAPTPFPMSIFDNVAYGMKLKERLSKKVLAEKVEHALVEAGLWDEVKDKLKARATELSGGQQQRLVIARALAVNPEVILFDEPTSALDPISSHKIEKLIHKLKGHTTIVIVTHNMQQAMRLSDFVAFFWLGELIEHGTKEKIFHAPEKKMTKDYVQGLFG
jgi:phosphate transport system ATP-binding protein